MKQQPRSSRSGSRSRKFIAGIWLALAAARAVAVPAVPAIPAAPAAQAAGAEGYEELCKKADAAIANNDWRDAIPHLSRLHELAPDDLDVISGLASAYINLPEEKPGYPHALPLLLAAESRYSEDGAVYYNLACVYSVQGKVDAAFAEFEKALLFGFVDLDWASGDPDLAALRERQQWKRIDAARAPLKGWLKTFQDVAGSLSDMKPETVIRRLEPALQGLAKELPGASFDAAALFCLAGAYQETGAREKALGCYERSLSSLLSLLGGEAPQTMAALERIGGLCSELGDFDRSVSCFERAIAIRTKLFGEDDLDVAADCSRLTGASAGAGDMKKAIMYAERGMGICLRNPDCAPFGAIQSCVLAGQTYFNGGDNGRAVRALEEALRLALRDEKGSEAILGTIYQTLGMVYNAKGDIAKAISSFEAALAAQSRARGEESLEAADCHVYLGMARLNAKDPDAAIPSLTKALGILAKLRDSPTADREGIALAEASCYSSLGMARLFKNDPDGAIACFDKLSANVPSGALNRMVSSFMTDYAAGIAYYFKGDYAKAIARLESVASSKASRLSGANEASVRSILGLACGEAGRPAEAKEHFRAMLRCWASSTNYQGILDSVWTVTKACLSTDRAFALESLSFGIAKMELARLDLSSAKTGIMAKSLPLYYAGVDLEASRGDAAKAFEYSEALRSRGFLDQLGTEAALRLGGISEAERARVKALIARMEGSRAELERQYALPADERDPKAAAEAGTSLAAAEKELAALDESIGARLPKYAQLRNPRPAGVGEARRWCGPGRAVLEYVLWDPSLETALVLGGSGDARMLELARMVESAAAKLSSYCLVLTEGGVEAVKLDGSYDWAKAVRELRGLVGQAKDSDRLVALKGELYAKLLAPALDKLPAGVRELVVVPDGPLSALPFDILGPGSAGPAGPASPAGPDLGSRYVVCLSPSVSVSALRSSREPAPGRPSLALGGGLYDPGRKAASRGFSEPGYARGGDGDESRGLGVVQVDEAVNEAKSGGAAAYFAARGFRWSDIPGTEREVEDIGSAAFGGKGIEIKKGAEASEATLKRLSAEGRLRGFDLIHLACHGYFDNFVPEMSSVVLSEVSGRLKGDGEDGYLTVPEVAALDLDARMVALSACSTGLARLRRGDGMVGLVRSFLVAGSRDVGVSLWNVDDDATREFMTRVYSKVLKEKLDFPRAYAAVKSEFRKDPRWSQPYYWAAFTIYE